MPLLTTVKTWATLIHKSLSEKNVICSLFNFCPHSAQSRRHEVSLVGLDPQTKLQAPKLKHETLYISGLFVSFYNAKPPPHKRKAPLLKLSSSGSESAAYSSFVHK